jgi:hypothetical protein
VFSDQNYDIALDDDSANELTDVVGIALSGDEILFALFHWKFSSDPQPVSRVEDLYENCGQAQPALEVLVSLPGGKDIRSSL